MGAPVLPSVFFIPYVNASRLSLAERVFPLYAPWELLPALFYYCRPCTFTDRCVSVHAGEKISLEILNKLPD